MQEPQQKFAIRKSASNLSLNSVMSESAQKHDVLYLNEGSRTIAKKLSSIVRKKIGTVDLKIDSFSQIVLESMKLIEGQQNLSGIDKRAIVVQVLASLFPQPEYQLLIFTVLPPLVDGIVSISKSSFKKMKKCCFL